MAWKGSYLELLNQTKLPGAVEYIKCEDYETVARAIRRLEVRGAPAIGAAAAFAFVLGARRTAAQPGDFFSRISAVDQALRQTRPTAVNLFWALDRMMAVVESYKPALSVSELLLALEQEAVKIAAADRAVNQRIGDWGAGLFTRPAAVLTHCNAGALATVGMGTALGVIRRANAAGRIKMVYVDETRPLLQGARLTAWELTQDQIPATLITDSMAGWVMKNKMVDAVIVGADRITRNGDVANKIGTYSVAVLAMRHHIPFYVAAPASTFDFGLSCGADIPIEERAAAEVTHFGDVMTAPPDVKVFNPAFDVTEHELITAIITEYGVLYAPYGESIQKLEQTLRGGN